jgi:hypothetical protein
MDIRDRQSRARDDAQPATLFHAVSNNPPQESDFWSNEREGKKRPPEAWKVHYWRGFSTFDTLQQTRNKAISFPRQGKYVAEMLLSSDSVTLIVQRFCPLAVDSRVSTDDSSPVSLC